MFRELFEFGLIQTDANFANFLYCGDSARLGLLDFGATRSLPDGVTDGYRRLLAAAVREDRQAMAESAQGIGYFREAIHADQREAVIDLFLQVTEPARMHGRYDFGSSDLPQRIRDAGLALSFERGYWHTPPADVLEAAKAEIEQEANRAREELRGQVSAIAVASAEKILKREIDDKAGRG